MRRARHFSILCGAVSLLAIQAGGFPIDPVPLRGLVAGSDLIAVARVVPESAPKGRTQPYYSSIFRKSPVSLKISSILKGRSTTDVVQVHFDANLVCPAPPRFENGTNMLVYLRKRATGGYETVALSYGAKVATDQEVANYSKRIRELVEIERIGDSRTKLAKTVEWLVDCAEDPVTRWDGAIELTDRVMLLGKTNASQFAQYLTMSHLARLSNGLFKTEFVRYDELALCKVFEKQARGRVVDYLIKYLQRVSQPVGPINGPMMSDSVPQPWVVYDVMWTVNNLLSGAPASQFLEKKVRTGFFSCVERTNSIQEFLPLIERAMKQR